jgi:hypothetical protein
MDKPTKEYKVTYKTFYNERLQKSLFHNKLMHPLYVQVTFDRIPIYFKSYYYDLFSKPKYAKRAGAYISAPDIKEIINMEKNLIEFIIAKNKESFSLNLFKMEYAFYSRDLLDNMEEGFTDYLYVFFNDKGMPSFATALQEGCKTRIVYDVVADMKNALNKKLYDELIENSFYYAPPYFVLYGYMQEIKKSQLQCLTVLEWQDEKIKLNFSEYLKKIFKDRDALEIIQRTDKWIIQTV